MWRPGSKRAVAVIHNFEQVLRLGTGEGVAEPVIGPKVRADDQELGASECVEERESSRCLLYVTRFITLLVRGDPAAADRLSDLSESYRESIR